MYVIQYAMLWKEHPDWLVLKLGMGFKSQYIVSVDHEMTTPWNTVQKSNGSLLQSCINDWDLEIVMLPILIFIRHGWSVIYVVTSILRTWTVNANAWNKGLSLISAEQ